VTPGRAMDALAPPWKVGTRAFVFSGGFSSRRRAGSGMKPGEDAMGSLRGFRCERCRAELLARSEPRPLMDRRAWTPPVLCCGRPLRALDPEQILLFTPSRHRGACCPRCGFQVRVVVHPAGSLVCMVCQTDLVILASTPDRNDRVTTAVTPAADV
jgi:hypothetical protein